MSSGIRTGAAAAACPRSPPFSEVRTDVTAAYGSNRGTSAGYADDRNNWAVSFADSSGWTERTSAADPATKPAASEAPEPM